MHNPDHISEERQFGPLHASFVQSRVPVNLEELLKQSRVATDRARDQVMRLRELLAQVHFQSNFQIVGLAGLGE